MFTSKEVLRLLPPTLIIVGDAELMLGESLEFAARSLEAGVKWDADHGIQLHLYPKMWHCFPFSWKRVIKGNNSLRPKSM